MATHKPPVSAECKRSHPCTAHVSGGRPRARSGGPHPPSDTRARAARFDSCAASSWRRCGGWRERWRCWSACECTTPAFPLAAVRYVLSRAAIDAIATATHAAAHACTAEPPLPEWRVAAVHVPRSPGAAALSRPPRQHQAARQRTGARVGGVRLRIGVRRAPAGPAVRALRPHLRPQPAVRRRPQLVPRAQRGVRGPARARDEPLLRPHPRLPTLRDQAGGGHGAASQPDQQVPRCPAVARARAHMRWCVPTGCCLLLRRCEVQRWVARQGACPPPRPQTMFLPKVPAAAAAPQAPPALTCSRCRSMPRARCVRARRSLCRCRRRLPCRQCRQRSRQLHCYPSRPCRPCRRPLPHVRTPHALSTHRASQPFVAADCSLPFVAAARFRCRLLLLLAVAHGKISPQRIVGGEPGRECMKARSSRPCRTGRCPATPKHAFAPSHAAPPAASDSLLRRCL